MHSLNTGAVQDVNVFGALRDFGRLCFGFWVFFFSVATDIFLNEQNLQTFKQVRARKAIILRSL